MSLPNHNIHTYFCGFLFLMLQLLMTACEENKSHGINPDDITGSYMTFRIIAPKNMSQNYYTSRATPDDGTSYWGDDYVSEGAIGFDIALLKNEFNVFITDNSGTQVITRLSNIFCYEANSDAHETVFNFLGEIPQNDLDNLKKYADARIHIVANSGPDILMEGNLNFVRAGLPSESFAAIPMWGVVSYNFSTLKSGLNDAGDIWLLRAMAKVEIVIDTANNNNIISGLNSAVISNANVQGYVLPQNWNKVNDTKSLSFEKTLQVFPSIGTINIQSETANKLTFYLPETRNTDGKAEIKLNYTIVGDESKSSSIKFARYVNGSLSEPNYDIVRNHLYRFEVMANGVSDKLEVSYTVCPWQEFEITPPSFD